MGFLDNVKKKTETAEGTTTPAVKPNPLAASKPNPLTAKAATEQTTTEAPKKTLLVPKKGPAATTEKPVASPLAAKPNPFGPKKTIEPKAEEVKTEEPTEVAQVPSEEVKSEEPVTEKSIVEEIKEENAASTEAVPAVEEKKPTPKGKGGKKTSAKETEKTAVKEPVEAIGMVEIPTTAISYAEAMLSITSPFVDEEWETYRGEIQTELDEIIIEDDMNAATLKSAISKLSSLRNKVWNNYQGTKAQYESLSSKEPEGLIERIKRINLGDATNDMQRKKAGVEACMGHIDKDGNLINLYEVLDETRARYNFLRGVMDSIEYKRSVLVTMNGALKIEKDLA